MIYSKTIDLMDPVRLPVIDLLYRLADDGLIIGHRNSEWTGLGPAMEEDIAFSNMAQDKMGHALAMYNLLHEMGEPEPDVLVYQRREEEFRCCSLVVLECFDESARTADSPLSNNPTRDSLLAHGDWAIALVRQFFFSAGDEVRFAALAESTFAPLAALARKFRGEIKYHTMHDEAMLQRLGRGTTKSGQRIQTAVDALWPHALGMFEPTNHDKVLVQSGICPLESELCDAWRESVEPLLRKSGIDVPAKANPIYGGRSGKHSPELTALLDDLQKVARLDPGAKW